MTESARVTSIDAIVSFESSLRTFQDEASQVLLVIEQQARRALEWLEQDAPVYWRQKIREAYDDVSRARTALQTCRMKKVGNSGPACLEEQQEFRKAQERLRKTEEMLQVVNRCAQRVRREIDEYRGRIMGFRNQLEGGIPRSLAMLGGTVAALESYFEHSVVDASLERGDKEPAPVPLSTLEKR
jgi:tetrahydromethanopterin S-methyltransferase subunit G